jgi:hypothetical protein
MSKIIPHGERQSRCLFMLSCVSQITGISYDTLYKRYHRGALKATKYCGILFIDYPELKRLEKQKKEEDKDKEFLNRDSSVDYQVYFNKRKVI